MKTRTLALAMASVAAAALDWPPAPAATGQVAGADSGTLRRQNLPNARMDFRLVDQNSNAHLPEAITSFCRPS